MHIVAPALILSVRPHGEHGAIVRALTPADGMQPGYVRGGRSRVLRPVLQPANAVLGEWRARTGEQLASLTVELIESRAALHGDPLAAAALSWVTALTATALPEAQPYPRLYEALDGVIGALAAAPSARGWLPGLIRYELLVLAELGFGLALDRCVVTGERGVFDLVSPRSGGAVSRAAAGTYAGRMLRLPPFLLGGSQSPDWPDLFDGMRLTGHFLDRDILADRREDVGAARQRLTARLKRAVA
ncbi:DNA repair protein RecO [Sphingomonas gellani]|uniref:DNA repair protein RecO n=1 Tax=Sphingomonas gellani TaxID=1166340 RepID=UPI000B89F116|nr:DNA repair protein RecO [Sphingomonas gellani]